MPEIVKGFDSRYTTTIPEDTEYKFAGIKISQAVIGGPYEQPLIQWERAVELGLAKLPFHFWRGSNDDPEQDGAEQAEWFFSVYNQHYKPIGEAELPPCLDAEDSYALKGLRSLRNLMAFLKRTEQLWNRRPIIYSAGWWWDTWIKPYTLFLHPIYSYDLWEADPPPDTPIGYWSESKIVQVRLDFAKHGFNASIDEDEAQKIWYNNQVGTLPPPGNTTKEKLEALLVKFENNVEELEQIIGEM